MKSLKNILLVGSIMVLSGFIVQQSVNWEITNDYSIKFSGTKVEGIFKNFSGDIQFDEADLASSKFVLKIEVSSINTGNGMKNKHAKSDKWFDAANYPNIEFQSSQISKTEMGYSVIGKMKIHGIEKEITIPFTYTNNVFASSFSVNRLDYEVGTMEGPGKKVSNEIRLEVSIPVKKK
jgi:polyisoprenoid-binding protein YceI